MLCFRCEHRAKFLEKGWKPRYECGCVNQSVNGCYMFEPCHLITFQKSEGDNRPLLAGWMVSARITALRLAESTLKYKKKGKEIIAFWKPKDAKSTKKNPKGTLKRKKKVALGKNDKRKRTK